MTAVLAGVLPIFLLIALGYGLKASRFLPREAWGPVERFAIYVLYPGFLVPSIWQADLSGLSAGALGLSVVGSVVLVGGLTVLIRPLLKVPDPTFTSIFQGVTRWNAFVFLPVIGAIYGAEGLAMSGVVISALIPVVNVMCVLVLVRWGADQPRTGVRAVTRSLVQNPILVSCFVGLILNALKVPAIPGLTEALKMLGQAALPAGLVIAGAGLSFSHAMTRPWTIGTVSAVKLLVLPLIMWGLCRLLGGDALAQGVALACGTAPGAAASYVLARQMGGDAPVMAGIVALTTVASAVTIPLMLGFLGVMPGA